MAMRRAPDDAFGALRLDCRFESAAIGKARFGNIRPSAGSDEFHATNTEGGMRYELYYWPDIQGRGEFVRLALEAAEAEYVDIARESSRKGMGVPAMMRLLESDSAECLPFAPPFLKAGDQIIGQTANILLFLGARHDLAPRDDAGRLWAHQLQLTVSDFVVEIHDTHHPIASGLYYEDQKAQAAMRAEDFIEHRLPKFLDYFGRVLAHNPHKHGYMVGARLTYVDLSMFQLIEGLRYAFPKAFSHVEKRHAALIELHDRVAQHPPVARYLASERRIPFNEQGIFRHYAELDR